MTCLKALQQCVILAGGLGTRMQGLYSHIPKALIPVNGKTFLEHQIMHLHSQGIEQILLLVGHKSYQIEEFIRSQTWPLEIVLKQDGPELLGTGGALRESLSLLDSSFFLIYGDSYLPISFQAVRQFYFQEKRKALMCVYENRGALDKSNVIYKDHLVLIYDKFYSKVKKEECHYIDYGLSILSPQIISDLVPPGKSDLSQVFHSLSLSQDLAGFLVQERFFEIGSPQGLMDFEKFIKGPV